MARVTVEDCIDKVDSPYELVLVAKERATQLNSGIEPTILRFAQVTEQRHVQRLTRGSLVVPET